jgi:signal transduction histidine kinase
LIAVGLGWLVATHALAPVQRMADVARRISHERLGERIALEGPKDELHELADGLDAMLDRLQAAVEAQGRFVANASHELRTPLTVMQTELDVTLSDPDATAAELRRMGEVLQESTARTSELLDALLVLASASRGTMRDEPADLGAIGERVAVAAGREARAAGIDLSVAVEPAPVRGDPALLERMVANLVENAIRHNRSGGSARLVVGPGQVRVTNDGEPIPAEALPRLTEPFERLTRCSQVRGSGLGLSIVQAVAHAHGGAVALAGRPGGGLDATVTLPYEH